MSVPLPAIFVEMVMAYFLPACATVSASLAAYWVNYKKREGEKVLIEDLDKSIKIQF